MAYKGDVVAHSVCLPIRMILICDIARLLAYEKWFVSLYSKTNETSLITRT